MNHDNTLPATGLGVEPWLSQQVLHPVMMK